MVLVEHFTPNKKDWLLWFFRDLLLKTLIPNLAFGMVKIILYIPLVIVPKFLKSDSNAFYGYWDTVCNLIDNLSLITAIRLKPNSQVFYFGDLVAGMQLVKSIVNNKPYYGLRWVYVYKVTKGFVLQLGYTTKPDDKLDSMVKNKEVIATRSTLLFINVK